MLVALASWAGGAGSRPARVTALPAATGTVAAHRVVVSAAARPAAAHRIPGGTVPVTALPPGTRDVALTAPGRRRSYLLVRPPAARGRTALVVLLHGTGASAAEEMARTGFGELADAVRFTLAVPASIGSTWNSGAGCCSYAARRRINDASFVHAVIRDVTRRVAVDPARIYLVGYSNGGKLSYEVACLDALPQRPFAGLATYGAGPQVSCPSTSPLPLFAGYGASDRLEPPAGEPPNWRGRHPGEARTAALFRARDHCTAAVTRARVGPVRISRYADCAAGTAVETAVWAGQTHVFPRSPTVPVAAAGATLMWDFLRTHRAVG